MGGESRLGSFGGADPFSIIQGRLSAPRKPTPIHLATAATFELAWSDARDGISGSPNLHGYRLRRSLTISRSSRDPVPLRAVLLMREVRSGEKVLSNGGKGGTDFRQAGA